MENRKKIKRNCLQLSLGNGQNQTNLIFSGSNKNLRINLSSKDSKKTKRICQSRKPMWIPPPAKTTRLRKSCHLYNIPENDILLTLPEESKFQLPEGIPLVIESCHLENFKATIYPQTLERTPSLIEGFSDSLDDYAKHSKKQSAIVKESEKVVSEHKNRKNKFLKHLSALKKNMEEMNESIKEIEKQEYEPMNLEAIEKIIQRQLSSDKQVHDSSHKRSDHLETDSIDHSPDIISLGSKSFIHPAETNIPSEKMLEKITEKDELKTRTKNCSNSNQKKISSENFMMKLMDSMRKSKQLLDETVQRNYILNETRKKYMHGTEKLCKDQQRLLSEVYNSVDTPISISSEDDESFNTFDNKKGKSKNNYYGKFTKSIDDDLEEFSEVGFAKFKINSMPNITHHLKNQSLAEQLAIANYQLERLKREVQLTESKKLPRMKPKADNLERDTIFWMQDPVEKEIEIPVNEKSETDLNTNLKEAIATIIHRYNTLKQINNEKCISEEMQTENRMKTTTLVGESEVPVSHSVKENEKYLSFAKKAIKKLEEEMEKLKPKLSDKNSQTEPILVEHYEKNISIEPVRGTEMIKDERIKQTKTKRKRSSKEKVKKEINGKIEVGTNTDQKETDPASISVDDMETNTRTSKDMKKTDPASMSIDDTEASPWTSKDLKDIDPASISTDDTETSIDLKEIDPASISIDDTETSPWTSKDLKDIDPASISTDDTETSTRTSIDLKEIDPASISIDDTETSTRTSKDRKGTEPRAYISDTKLKSLYSSNDVDAHAIENSVNIKNQQDSTKTPDNLVSGSLPKLSQKQFDEDIERTDVNGGKTHVITNSAYIGINEQNDEKISDSLVPGFISNLSEYELDIDDVEKADENNRIITEEKQLHEVQSLVSDSDDNSFKLDDNGPNLHDKITNETMIHDFLPPLTSTGIKDASSSTTKTSALKGDSKNVPFDKNLIQLTSKGSSGFEVGEVSTYHPLKEKSLLTTSINERNQLHKQNLKKRNATASVQDMDLDVTRKDKQQELINASQLRSKEYEKYLDNIQHSGKLRSAEELDAKRLVSKAIPSIARYRSSQTKAHAASDQNSFHKPGGSTVGLDSRPVASIRTSQDYAIPTTSGGYNPYLKFGPYNVYSERLRPTTRLDLKKHVSEPTASTSGYRPSQVNGRFTSGFRTSTPVDNKIKSLPSFKIMNQKGIIPVKDNGRSILHPANWAVPYIDEGSFPKDDITVERVNEKEIPHITDQTYFSSGSGKWTNPYIFESSFPEEDTSSEIEYDDVFARIKNKDHSRSGSGKSTVSDIYKERSDKELNSNDNFVEDSLPINSSGSGRWTTPSTFEGSFQDEGTSFEIEYEDGFDRIKNKDHSISGLEKGTVPDIYEERSDKESNGNDNFVDDSLPMNSLESGRWTTPFIFEGSFPEESTSFEREYEDGFARIKNKDHTRSGSRKRTVPDIYEAFSNKESNGNDNFMEDYLPMSRIKQSNDKYKQKFGETHDSSVSAWLHNVTPRYDVSDYNYKDESSPKVLETNHIPKLSPDFYLQRNSIKETLENPSSRVHNLDKQRLSSIPVNYIRQQKQVGIHDIQNPRSKNVAVDYNTYQQITESTLQGERLFPISEENKYAKNINSNKENNGKGLTRETESQKYISSIPQIPQNRKISSNIRSHSTTPPVFSKCNPELLQRRKSFDLSNNEKQQIKIRKLYNDIMS